MKNIIFLNHYYVGDTILSYLVIDTLSYYYPALSVYVYNKNINGISPILQKHSNVKSLQGLYLKIFRIALYKNTFNMYKQIKVLLEEGDVYISSILGSVTLHYTLLPFLLLLKVTRKNRVHILQLRPKWFKYNCHLIDFHCRIASHVLEKQISYHENKPLFRQQKIVKPKSIAILSGASHLSKSLSPHKFVYIVNHFINNGYSVKILGSKSDIDTGQAQKIMELSNKGVINMVGKTTLDEYISEIANSSYVITNDSSGQHVSHVCNTPCAILWGRDKNNIITVAYSWNTKNTLNIYNDKYQYCKKCSFWNKFKTKAQVMQSHHGCNECIKINLELLDINSVITEITKHMQSL